MFENSSGGGDSNLPQFPAVDLPVPTVNLPLSGDPTRDFAGTTASSIPNDPASSFPSAHFAAPGAASLAPPSGATLSSMPNPGEASGFSVPISASTSQPSGSGQPQTPVLPDRESAANTAGPSIAFDAGPALDHTAIDDLIGAVGEFGGPSPELPSGLLPPNIGTASQEELLRGDAGHLASRTMPNDSLPIESADTHEISESTLPPFVLGRSKALELAESGELTRALEMLSQYYESPELSYAEHTDLIDILDALAREVIYSDRPLLRPKHTVSVQDTLAGLAEKHRINSEFIAAVNQMGQSQALLANTQIKLIDGPFRAQVSLSRGELTLFLRKLYAGRFPVSISQKNVPALGTYEVVDRRKDRTYYSANAVIPAEAPTNPYGGYWLSLGGNLSIHGSPQQVTGELEGAGCISLAPLDAADVYRILTKGSSVEIRQ